jgi:molecular chaperone DnaK
MSKNIGIDLGTTYCSIATIDEAGRPVIVKNPSLKDSPKGILTASCVMLSGKNIVIGESPRRMLGRTNKVVSRFKRDMGTKEKYHLGDRECEAKDLSTILLSKLREAAEKELGEIGTAVVTIPANFDNEARDQTMQAAIDAGLDVKNIINEPTAAALYYAYTHGGLSGVYAIYDLGGGTFDISIIKADGTDIEIISSNGIPKLGGVDFDQKLVELVRKKYKEETGEELTSEDYTVTEAEEDKIALSKKSKIIANDDELGSLKEIIEITRSEFVEAISNLVMQTEIMLQATIEEAGVDVSEINEIIMVGGSTRIPSISESIKNVFKRDPVSCDKVDEAVSLGAALYASHKGDQSNLNEAQKRSMDSLNIVECANHCFGTISIGVNSAGEPELQNSIIIKKNEKLPISNTESFETAHEGQDGINCRVTQSVAEETNPDYVKILQEIPFELPPNRPAGLEIQVTYSYDENEMMTCKFKDIESGKEVVTKISMSGQNDEDDIEKFLVD